MNYSEFVAALVAETNIEATNAGLVAILPTIIDQTEGMIYREPGLHFLSSTVTDETGFTIANQQRFTLPRVFTILEQVNIVQGNDRPPLEKTSREWLQAIYSSRIAASVTDVPSAWAPLTDQVILLGPTPGGTTQLECIGTARPANLSASNPTTWLWTYLGDLAFAASMVFISGYMRNFGSQADDVKMALSWKAVYDALLPGASTEEMRRKFEATGGA
jgi:hypothetical protein